MSSPADVAAAEARAAEARARLNGTVEQLQEQLAPRKLARTAAENMTEGAQLAARASVKTAMRNPSAVTGGVAAIVMLLCRKPLARALGLSKRPPSAATPPHLKRGR
ncbi:DUF3618 domain-containing protein [Sphingomonas sp. RHCKR47]|uniref:DUF3618 domain-containing protein n=1 Tax=Sphingomonas citricola TaxID=2862498 RepID=UPI001CA4C7C9|nr:DUF3618 domain-containing protein [Sphingomonas citricola]MBW6523374.1 DUF3618 domain-containing protein [Sphingomonas citricola]